MVPLGEERRGKEEKRKESTEWNNGSDRSLKI